MFNFIMKYFRKEKYTETTNESKNAAVNSTAVIEDNSYPEDRKELSKNPYAFKLSPVESWRYDNFVKEHCRHGGITGVFFKPNGITLQVTCKCDKCNIIKDITEYD